MESMRRGEANTSHHPQKVAINSLVTENNKQSYKRSSSVSGNLCNNNKTSFNHHQQQQKQTTQESLSTLINTNTVSREHNLGSTDVKETNFEYDDNEWDVGGIGDLIIDLDADIEKSSGVINHQHLITIGNSTSSSSTLPSSDSEFTKINSVTNTTNNLKKNPTIEKEDQIEQSTECSRQHLKNTSNPLEHSNILHPNPTNKTFQPNQITKNSEINNTESNILLTYSSLTNTSDTSLVSSCQKVEETETQNDHQKLQIKDISVDTKMSTNNQNCGKSGTHVTSGSQGNHQGLIKIKIKRTKTGTKTSEAKHEIVKAEQNGTISGAEESNNAGSNGSTKKHQHVQQIHANTPLPTQSNKRGSSGHRRDKGRDKTPHSRATDRSNTSNSSVESDRNMAQQTSVPVNLNQSLINNTESVCSCINETSTNGKSICTTGKCTQNIGIDQANQRHNSLPNQISISGNSNLGNPHNISGNNFHLSQSLPTTTNVTLSSNISTDGNNSSHQIINNTISSVSLTNTDSADNLKIMNNAICASSSGIMILNESNLNSIDSVNVMKDINTNSISNKMKSGTKEMVNVCVGTSVGTITEPECLGPCEPGTSVTLEGIVWHETEGGVLVVNVTWRGKTYVGTLLDCTRHDWAPPRFCDSPTEELDSRTPKGRGKRGRSSALTPSSDLSNFTETRSSVHSKLRNGGSKGRGGRAPSTSNGNNIINSETNKNITATSNIASCSTTNSIVSQNTPSTSPIAFLPPRPEKRKSKDENTLLLNGEQNSQNVINPVTGLNVQIPTKKAKTTSPCAISPVMLECPEQDCNKKYKHVNGLLYHQSFAHGAGSMDEDSSQPESPRLSTPSALSPIPQQLTSINKTNISTDTTEDVASITNILDNISNNHPSAGGSITTGLANQAIQQQISVVTSPPQTIEDPNNQLPYEFQPVKINHEGTINEEPEKVDGAIVANKTQKKRKDGTELDSTVANRDDVQSPAYSDISDDSNPIGDHDLPDKSQKQTESLKKAIDGSLNQVGSHGMYPLYQFPQPYLLSDYSVKGGQSVPIDYNNKNKEPPLDLITKSPIDSPTNSQTGKDNLPNNPLVSANQTKGTPFYHPYNYMPGYPFTLDPNYGPVSMVTDETKLLQQSNLSKEDRIIKDNPSDNIKISSSPINSIAGKLSKNESPSVKDFKTENIGQLNSNVSTTSHNTVLPNIKEINSSPHGIHAFTTMYHRGLPVMPQSPAVSRDEDYRRIYMFPDQRRSSGNGIQSGNIIAKEEAPIVTSTSQSATTVLSQSKNIKNSSLSGIQPSNSNKSISGPKDIKEEKEVKIKHEGQKPTMETQGPPPPPTSQYYLHPSYMTASGQFPGYHDPGPTLYRNMLVQSQYAPPYHLQMSRFHGPEDLSRNPSTKALDLLQHHASQCNYGAHKIHELSERALKSPTGQTKVNAPSPSVPVNTNSNVNLQPPNTSSSTLPLAAATGTITSNVTMPQKGIEKHPGGQLPDGTLSCNSGIIPSTKDGSTSGRSPPPQRHVHTHHHTHVGLGYPMYPAQYGAAVLASQQAAAVAVINPYPPGPAK